MAEDIFRHFLSGVRKTTSSLIRRITAKKLLDQSQQQQRTNDKKRFERNMSDYQEFLQRYEQLLNENKYLTGSKRTFVDIVVYMEIDTIRVMYKQEFSADFPSLKAWFKALG